MVSVCALLMLSAGDIHAQSLDIGYDETGISFGNSKRFSGLRFNLQDRGVESIKGANVTFWCAYDNNDAKVTGLSLGLAPEAGTLRGLQVGIVVVGASKKLCGVSVGFLAAGSGESVNGITIGGLASGAGERAGGILLGGLAAGAGEEMHGFAAGLLAAGAGEDVVGISVGGLAAGAGERASGIMLGGLAAGAGDEMNGLALGLLAAGAGDSVNGITIGGLAAGAGDEVRGLTIGGLAAGGTDITGAICALGMVRCSDEGSLTGFAASAYNHIEGRQTGISVGIVNMARELNGVQFGVINYVRENPPVLRILPILNIHLD